jgi:hypothetical protein
MKPSGTSSKIRIKLTAKYSIKRVSLFEFKDIYKNLLKSGFILLSKPSVILFKIETEGLYYLIKK